MLYYLNLLFGTNMHSDLKTNDSFRIDALEAGYANQIKPNFLLFNTLDNKRLSFETFEEYKFRQKITKRTVKKLKKM